MSVGHLGAAIWHRSDYYLWGPDKPETIGALKDNIREAVGEIQLHTIDNMLKNGTDRVDYYMANRGSHLNKIMKSFLFMLFWLSGLQFDEEEVPDVYDCLPIPPNTQ